MAKTDGQPTSAAAATRVVLDAVRTTFGMAVMVLFFFGVSLVALSSGFGSLSAGLRAGLMWTLILLMVTVLGAVFGLRLWRPEGLAGPPSPLTEDVTFSDSSIF